MIAFWRVFRVFRAGRRRQADRFRPFPALGLEPLEDRRLLTGSVLGEPGFVLSEDEVEVWESGMPGETSKEIFVELTTQPTSDVTFNISSSNPDEAMVDPERMTFTPDNWDVPQPILILGVDNHRIGGNQGSFVTVSIDWDSSDHSFTGVPDQYVAVTLLDDDVAGFQLSRTSLTVSESGTTDSFTVVLTARPDSSVTLVAISDDESEVTVEPMFLTFLPNYWDQPQTVTVTGEDDDRVDGNQETSVTVAVSADISDYQFREMPAQTVTVTTLDDDVAGFTLSKTVGIVSESGTTDSFSVVLTAQPDTIVTLVVSSVDPSKATATPEVLVFQPSSWNSPQEVTLAAVDDSGRKGDQETEIIVAVDADSSDSSFHGVGAQTVWLTILGHDYGWQNSANPFDVSGNGHVTAEDVLILITYINSNSGNPTLPPSPATPPPYYDVNNDGRLTAVDVLMVINYINNNGQSAAASGSSGAGEGEGSAFAVPSADAGPTVVSDPLPVVPLVEGQPVAADAHRLSAPLTWDLDAAESLGFAPAAGPSALALPTTSNLPFVPFTLPEATILRPVLAARSARSSGVGGGPWLAAVDAALESWDADWDDWGPTLSAASSA